MACLAWSVAALAQDAAPGAPEGAVFPPTTHPDVPDDFDGFSEHWTGAFFGPTAFAGLAWGGNAALSGDQGWTVGAGLRASSVMSLLDLQLDYRFTRLDAAWHDAPTAITHHAVGAVASIHPFFLANLGNDWLWYTVAATILQLGVSVDHVSVGFGDAPEASQVAPGLLVGFALETPLTDADAGGAMWLGVGYRLHYVAVDARPFDGDALWEHLLNLHLAYRHNGLPF